LSGSGVPPDTVTSEAREIRFHARVRKDDRIAIPQSERDAAGIREGDLVLVRILKLHSAAQEVR
jgi:hypothetical protein